MPHIYATASSAQTATELIAAPVAKSKRRVQQVYVNADTAMKVSLISGYTNEIQSVYTNATGGTFKLTYSGQETAALDFDYSAAEMVTQIELLSNVTDVTATGAGTSADPWLVTFVDPGGQDIALMTTDPASLTGVSTTIAEETTGVAAVNEIQSVFNGADGGTFTLSFGTAETTDLAYNIAAGGLKTALELLDGITTVTTSGAGTSGDPWIVTFTSPGATDVAILVADDTSLTNGTSTIAEDTKGVTAVSEIQSVYNDAGDGTFTLTYSGQTTAAIDYDATAAQMVIDLELLSNVTEVEATGTGTSTDPWLVTFINPGGPLAEMTATDTSLVEVCVVAESTPGGGTEKAAFHLGIDGVAVLPHSPTGWFDCGAAQALSYSSDTSGNVVVMVEYETVGGS